MSADPYTTMHGGNATVTDALEECRLEMVDAVEHLEARSRTYEQSDPYRAALYMAKAEGVRRAVGMLANTTKQIGVGL